MGLDRGAALSVAGRLVGAVRASPSAAGGIRAGSGSGSFYQWFQTLIGKEGLGYIVICSIEYMSLKKPLISFQVLYASFLQTSIHSSNLLLSKSVHAHIFKSGLCMVSVLLPNTLMNCYVKKNLISDAQKLFDEMPLKNTLSWNTIASAYAKSGWIDQALRLFMSTPKRDSVSWTIMISGYKRLGQFEKVIELFNDMIKFGYSPTEFTFTNVLGASCALKSLDIGKQVHSFVVKLGLSSYISVSNSLLNMYGKSKDVTTAKVIFDRMLVRSISSWNCMINLFALAGQLDNAQNHFEQMTDRDVISWNSIIAAYNHQGFDMEALEVFSEMLCEAAVKPDSFTMVSALSACASLEFLKLGKQIHTYLLKTELQNSGLIKNALISMYAKSGSVAIASEIVKRSASSDLNLLSYTSLLEGYVKLGDLQSARQVFDSMEDRDVVAWTAMIVGYVQNGFNNDAISIFHQMVNNGPKPNNFTFASMLSACSNLATLDYGRQLHAAALRFGEESSISVRNALVFMYAKAGSITGARKIFDCICHNKDTISWTSMIISLAQHGYGDEAIDLFEQMLRFGLKPDHITYVGVLSACTHAGLVQQGRDYFKMMQTVHAIIPTQSHYACMIDIFGRAGLLCEAHNLIENMPFEPDVIAWGSLLGACKVHKNLELAKTAAERLLVIDPDHAGAFSALANLYSSCGKWADAAKIRKQMRDRGVKKDQGSSWIQIKGKVHVFGAEDALHPQKEEIYKKAFEIWHEIKKVGFVPDTDSVLHDLDEEMKEVALSRHSEKLAIAFGLISTPKSTTLRIMKNLRVCNDCHSAIKFISKIVEREIVVRDATRFHHFKNGFCSCKDYW